MDKSFITARAGSFSDSFKQNNDDDFFKSPLPLIKLDSPNNFRRESLGILHEDFANASFSDFGRESMGFSKLKTIRESLMGKESLGIINLNDLSFKNDFPSINISDVGKGSLGIINFNTIDPDNDILLNTSNTSDFKSTVFDKGFLMLPTDRMSVLSSVSSSNSINPLFDGRNLEGISKIYSVSSMINLNNETNPLNVALSDTNEFMKNLSNNTAEEMRQRIQSLPTHLEDENMNSEEKDVFESPHKTPAKFYSAQPNRKSNFIRRNSLNGVLDFDDDDVFYKSIHIESRHMAQTIADVSIYHNEPSHEIKLENELPPVLVLASPENSPKKNDKQKIFETNETSVAIPFEELKYPTKCRNNSTDSNQSNLSRKSNNSNSSNAKELLQNLSDILTSQNRSHNQQNEGRKLLSSLADILTQSPHNKSLEDSGHSSICDNQDLSDEGDKPLKIISNESKEKSPILPKKATPKKGKENSPALFSKHVLRKNSDVVPLKPKPLKMAAGPAKKGPLKAVIPITNMVKRKTFTTPNKSQLHPPTMMHKKTSTPIRESNLRPMAQSTPTEKMSVSRLPQLSPMHNRVASLNFSGKLGSGGSTPDLSKSKSSTSRPTFSRQSSFTDSRKSSQVGKIRRCNSVGKEVGLMGALSQVRENIAKRLSENNNLMGSETPKMPSFKANLASKLKSSFSMPS
ncbi:unnamed protein product [Brassicogethes aeneus]|uniref:Uncharacterized protein n=1 Tax=Brassicogethes aeneus TaxID=1431903 RepID=A0A9P0B6L6_BRAAE|nr:unnamed protein product [Brassicogethes aeneus]